MQSQTTVAVLALLVLAAAPAYGAQAHGPELRTLFGGWTYDIEGTVDDDGTRYDFKDDLDLEPRSRRGFALEVDTPAGGCPDFTLSYTPIGARGEHREDIVLPPSTRTILTDVDFDIHELVARWPLYGSRWRLSAGGAVQRLRGKVVINDSSEAESRHQRYDETFPLLHLQLRRSSRKFALEVVAQGIAYDGSRALEWRALAEIRFLAPFVVQFGWQERRYEIELADYALDARVRGPVLRFGAFYR